MTQRSFFLHLSFALLLSACTTAEPLRTASAPAAPKVVGHHMVHRQAATMESSHLPPDAILLKNNYFTTVYNSKRNIAYYSEYLLTAEHLRMPKVGRSNKFHTDPQLQAKGLTAPDPSWYLKSGYDRGHLAPSADFNWDTDANYATFTMSNMTPQTPGLNRKAWAALEGEVRKWACAEDQLEVITGPVLEADLPDLNGKPVPVPRKFFKVVLRTMPPEKAVGFIMGQEDSGKDDYKDRVRSLDEIEQAAGISLFEDLLPAGDPARHQADLTQWHEGNCSGAGPGNHQTDNPSLNPHTQIPPGGKSDQCSEGILKSAEISGCCQGQHGVMGPKHHQACCDSGNFVLCNDGKPSPTCSCDGAQRD